MAQCLSYFSTCSTLSTGCYLYSNPKRTATVPAGWVFDGTTNWIINSSGMITGTASCQVAPAANSTWAGGFISETGQYQIVINTASGYLWESNDYGATWTQNTNAGSKSWKHISISSNGVYRVASTSLDLFVSNNSGSSYIGKGINVGFEGTAMSDSGEIMYATVYSGYVYKSTNYGATFSPNTNLGAGAWQFLSTSSNGQWVLVPDSNYSISMQRSGDYGVFWDVTGPTPAQDFLLSAMSNSGQHQIAGNVGGVGPYMSSDYGASFALRSLGEGYVKYYYSVAMSGSGQYILIADGYSSGHASDNGWIWRSTNYGASFTKAVGRPGIGTGNWWEGVGIGGAYALAVSVYHIFRSTDNGASWTEVLTDPATAPFFTPPYGEYLNSECVGCNLVAIRATGTGGSYQAEVIQYNTEACCTIGPGGGGGGGGGGGDFE